MDSAHILAERLHLPVIPMEILRERDWGNYTGLSLAEAKDKYKVDGRYIFLGARLRELYGQQLLDIC